MSEILQLLGFAGAVIMACAYMPQIIHLYRGHCSAGISVNAWILWLLASVLVFSHALEIFDLVFIVLQIVNMTATALIIVLARRYENMACAEHKRRK